MGINCNIYNKPIEEKDEIIRFSPQVSSHRDLNNAPTISDSAQKVFNERFNKEINELGEFIPNSNFQSQIPTNIKNYILKNKYNPIKKILIKINNFIQLNQFNFKMEIFIKEHGMIYLKWMVMDIII
jgi:hypothetical protein